MLLIAGTQAAEWRDGPCDKACFHGPMAVAITPGGELLVADADSRRIRKIHRTAEGEKHMRSMQLTNLPHTLHHPEEGEEAKAGRVKSEGDAEPSASEKEVPGKVAVKTKVVEAPPPPKSDFDRVSTLAGGGSAGSHDGPAQLATFFDPAGLAVDRNGNVFVSDAGSHTIRHISSGGVVSTLAGAGKPGNVDGKGNAAHFSFPYGIALSPEGQLYVADSANHKVSEVSGPSLNRTQVRVVTPSGEVRTLAGNGSAGFRDGSGHNAMFSHPTGIAVDSEGTIFVTDRGNHRVRKVTSKGTASSPFLRSPCGVSWHFIAFHLPRSSRQVSTLAGNGQNLVQDGKGAAASFSWPNAITLDPCGRGPLYVSDTFTFRIRK
ncbi:MAG: hypothetical protein SGPRY_004403, partial [Prymnesium sp.]